jgi:hypothetical membrane protein
VTLRERSRDAPARDRAGRALLAAGALAGPLFVAAFTLQGAVRDDYDWQRHPVSGLALGPGGWVQVVNFVVAGALLVAGAAGLWLDDDPAVRTRAGAVLVALAGAGLLLAGVFTTAPVSGYPPGTPPEPAAYTVEEALHDVVSMPVFLGLPLATWAFAGALVRARHRAWAAYSAASGLAMLVLFLLSGIGFSQDPGLRADAGLYQRLSIAVGLGWVTALSLRQLTRSGPPRRDRGSARSPS